MLASAEDQGSALAVYDQLRAAGYPAQIVPGRKDERTSYTVRIANLASQMEAQALAAQLRGKHGLAP